MSLSITAIAQGASERAQARQDAKQTCKELRASSGKANFRAMYGSNGYGRCVNKETRENVAEAQQAEETAHKNAAKQCKAERDDENFAASHDGKTFAEFYGTNRSGKNAYGKCVSQNARENEQEQDEENAEEDENQVNAAKQCKAEKGDENFAASHEGQSFAEFYGTNANNKNAFGKCVSQKAKAQNDEEEQEQEQPAQA
jgi:hypothetical protein